MLGWMLIFTLMVLGGTMAAVNGGIETAFGMTLTIVFGFLLAVSALTLLLRGRV